MPASQPTVLIVGAGFTGVAVAHDLALRGFQVTVLDRGPIANATSGRTHGLLHSGARYCVDDQEAAIECIDENLILREIAPEAIEQNGGLFVAINEGDLAYAEEFIAGAQASHIPIEELSAKETLRLEPNLNPKLLASFLVPDGSFEPLRLALAFAATAKSNGARFQLYTEVEDLLLDGKGDVAGVLAWDRMQDRRFELRADMVVNASGAWAGEIAAMAGMQVDICPTPGVMVAYDRRLAERIINRLNKPGDGDILVPQRRMLVVGTTSFEVEDLDYVPVYPDQVQLMLERGCQLVPGLKDANPRGAFVATRPLIGGATAGRSLSRTCKCYDHAESEGLKGFVTITGGKATTLRLMAEKAANLVCQKLSIQAPCLTRHTPLLPYRMYYTLPEREISS